MAIDDLINSYKQKVQSYKPTDYTESYAKIGQSVKDAYEAEHQGQVLQLNAEQAKQEKAARAQRTQAYADARTAAIGANENLASAGLARGLYDAPASGASELARVRQDTAMQKGINQINVAEQQMKDSIAQQIISSGYTKDLNVAQALADNELKRLQTQQSEEQFAKSYEQNAISTLVNQYYQELAAQQQAAELAYQKQQAAIANAYSELNTYGRIISPAAAQAIGMPVGTRAKK